MSNLKSGEILIKYVFKRETQTLSDEKPMSREGDGRPRDELRCDDPIDRLLVLFGGKE